MQTRFIVGYENHNSTSLLLFINILITNCQQPLENIHGTLASILASVFDTNTFDTILTLAGELTTNLKKVEGEIAFSLCEIRKKNIFILENMHAVLRSLSKEHSTCDIHLNASIKAIENLKKSEQEINRNSLFFPASSVLTNNPAVHIPEATNFPPLS